MSEDLPGSAPVSRRPGPVTARTIQLMRRAEEVFHQVADLPVAERESRARELASGDETVLGIVLDLLREDEGDAHGLIQESVKASVDAAAGLTGLEIVEVLPEIERIGPYRITDHIGEGGMGVVYKGLRDDEFQKVVAIKVVKRGMDTSAVLDRFVQERQILASFDHPNIAGLLDGGQTPDGRPYLVMDYVGGQSLTEFVQSRNPSTSERLRLFVSLCQAVDYAHRRLVVHRDIKPSNVRVNESGAPVLLDFGIAKLMEPGATVTRTGLLPALTPQYAAPEQVLGDPVTVATDVYALGLVLYELLTDTRAQPIVSLAHSEIERVVCRVEPPAVTVARPGLARDLDAIVSMAIRKEPQKRYASAALLADDVERFLNGYPVLARAGSRTYKARKFLKRHWKGSLLATGVAAGAILAAAALLRFAQQAERARATAEQEKETAQEVTKFLEDLFLVSEPDATRSSEVTAREILEAGAAKIAKNEDMKPAVRANVLELLARVYDALGRYEDAQRYFEQTLVLRRSLSAARPTAETLNQFGALLSRRGELRAAVALLRESVVIQRAAASPGDPGVLSSENNLGVALWRIGSCTEALSYFQQVLATHRARGNVTLVPSALNNVASCDAMASDYPRAEAGFKEAIAARTAATAAAQASTREDQLAMPRVLPTYEQNLALVWAELGRFDEALEALDQAVAIRRRVQGNAHPDLARALEHKTRVLVELQDWDDARVAQEEAARIRAAETRGPPRAMELYFAGVIALGVGDVVQAEVSLRNSVEMFRTTVDPDHPDTVRAISALGVALAARNDLTRAMDMQEQALAALLHNYAADHGLAGIIKGRMAEIHLHRGEFEEAVKLSEEALVVLRRRNTPEHPRVAQALTTKAEALQQLNRIEEARAAAEEARRILKLRSPPARRASVDVESSSR